MRSVSDHQAIVAALFGIHDPVTARVADALGCVTAAEVVAPIGLPGFDNSAMDGYAVIADEIASAAAESPVRLPVAQDIPAGRTDRLTLAAGTAHRIMTGAPLPAGADAVVPVEATDGAVDEVAIATSVPPGKHIRRAGSDIEAGETAIPAGTRLGPPQVGLLAALGVTEVSVRPRLRVVVLSTGSELVTPGEPLHYGQIYESNGPMLTASAQEAGADATHVHYVTDDVDAFRARLDEISDDADVIITSGGVSAGAFEVVKDALTGTGVEFTKVAMQPGMPQGCGHYTAPGGRRVPIITLPGNPVSSLVSFEVFIRPPLRAAMGLPSERRRVTARLTTDIRSPGGKRQFLRGVLGGQKGDMPLVDPIGPPASHHLRYLARADALIDIPAETDSVTAGSPVDVIVL
ncbi:molybdopterin molybdenumtransferase MoeA [Gordonia sp. SID5947]|uniref:molybdopterin molybdotransferase MoeA n=1 Tax=Gordonia sp. SID5947 TaxID=2690315 RepID=UPI00136DF20D|nr:gephyrin-like molybdotransferase Glp [Gordonia sp. SID5947]MYR07087.1 molybdopterin molybdenumtransferase MoeA [Gordonia sp. SID5947]